MADISSPSQAELSSRRRQLQRQRRWRMLQTTWQVLMVSALAGGLLWSLSRSDWMIRSPQQIKIEGNQFLSSETIRAVLPIRYPQSLLSIQPQAIVHQLETEAPIAEAIVTRRLFPPSLTIQIQERYPVAIAYLTHSGDTASTAKGGQTPKLALLDEEGAWIPHEIYLALNSSQRLPDLKVIGMREEYRSQWPDLYQQVSQSPVKIAEIDWRDPNNLILYTEFGAIYLGAYSSRLEHQLRRLDQMRRLPEQVNPEQVDYIDLRNPDMPLIEMKNSEN
ncbi:cell division protein FtsQ/DivIB [Thermocoleostomius sinensis]|uniref:FtsQ-type POTRA domain-containing protein n=1 Tax=Thermocoleostomius sinensis A174 TaxID=2016057 RepID=A0A9E8Z8S9_9CYAN|nr:FtsQ-type POTRA domain-containing protein [Thermocoleostomius sinensis]WAL58603.1 FtsQ-type POTRA domain-containing protein [Thermocoleostomius sinensis A174]